MEMRQAKELLHLQHWLAMAAELVQRGRDNYNSDPFQQEAGDSLMMKIGEVARRLDRMGYAPPKKITWTDASDNRNYLLHDYDAVSRNVTWQTLSVDLPEWGRAFAKSFVEARQVIGQGGHLEKQSDQHAQE
ncbi:MAG: DUF86 domain-containing protein [Propionibacteriaceae bacterium]|nr:DUF86 domain-containing protein [Propionibacteriaceae bacterium]